jgi:hypothetical protein
VFYFAVPDSFKPWVYVSLPRQWEHSGQIRSLLQEIPPEASVSASTYLVPHLSSRREVLRLPFLQLRNDQNQAIAVEYVVADLWQMQQYQPAFKVERGYLLDLLPRIDQLVESKSYGILGLKDGVVLLKRGEPSSPDLLNAWKELKRSYEASLEKET